jgi:hypothetical protein
MHVVNKGYLKIEIEMNRSTQIYSDNSYVKIPVKILTPIVDITLFLFN